VTIPKPSLEFALFVRERTFGSLIGRSREGQPKKFGARMVPETSARFEPVAWWYTRKQIGRGLTQYYQLAEDLHLDCLRLSRN
jgi:hypothetical protein